MRSRLALTWERRWPPERMRLVRLPHPQEATLLTLPQARRRLQGDLADVVPAPLLQPIGRDLGHSCRQRTLTPVGTTYRFRPHVWHGHPAVGNLRHLRGLDVTASAYCRARAAIPR